ncbi:MAG: SGNH/GDSL hydrolase family protein [Candidatus Omnitrophica bacterium]|nr:SGNH/GDSL hydrolase family protein [Candidatus Omnitrophota bacterium]
MSPQKSEENIAMSERVARSGFKSEKELFQHYAKVSGKTYSDIEKSFGREKGWKKYLSRKYFSGCHSQMQQMQKMHLGLAPKPNQKLQTLEIDGYGRRKTGFDYTQSVSAEKNKTCLFIGGSIVFGFGATSDKNTIPGKVEYFLNQNKSKNTNFRIINAGGFGFNSLQDLIALLQSNIKPDYVISLGGYNDLDQAFFSENSKVSSLAKACDYRANDLPINRVWSKFLNRFAILQVLRRFIKAFILYGEDAYEEIDYSRIDIYPLF